MADKDGFTGIARDLVGAAAAAAEAEAAAAIAAAGEQLDMLELLPVTRLAGAELERAQREAIAQAAPRGRGRPLGAGNLATRDVKRVLVKMFGDPLLESARWLLHSPRSMAAELGCTVLEAWDRQQKIRDSLAPFVHARLGPVGEDGRAIVPAFNLVLGSELA